MSRQFIGSYRKQPGEELDYYVDYSSWLASGQTIDTAALTVQPVTTPPLVTSDVFTVDDIVLGFRVSGGLSGSAYQVTISATDTSGQIVEREIRYSVEEF